MSLSVLTSTSPEGVVTACAAGIGILALARCLFKLAPEELVDMPPVPVIVQAPPVEDPVDICPVPVVVPAGQEGPGNAQVVPVAVQAPPNPQPVNAPPVDYLAALTVFYQLLMDTKKLMVTTFVGHGITRTDHRICGLRDFRRAIALCTNWMSGTIMWLGCLHQKAIQHGNHIRAGVDFDLQAMADFARNWMMAKIFQIVDPNNPWFAQHAVLLEVGHWAGSVVSKHGLARSTGGSQYPVYQHRNIRLDTLWSLLYFLIAKGFLMLHGFTQVQANYVACTTVIKAVKVAYGQPIGIAWGPTPDDFGFQVPATLSTN